MTRRTLGLRDGPGEPSGRAPELFFDRPQVSQQLGLLGLRPIHGG